MSVDDILDVIDAGLQSSAEGGMDVGDPELCVRCQATAPVVDGDLCVGCRAFLLDDSDVDPARRDRWALDEQAAFTEGEFAQLLYDRISDVYAEQSQRNAAPDAQAWMTATDDQWRTPEIPDRFSLGTAWANEGDTVTIGGTYYTVTEVHQGATGITMTVAPIDRLSHGWTVSSADCPACSADPMAGRCLICGEAQHDGVACTRTDMAEPLGFVPRRPRPFVTEARRHELDLLDRARRTQRRTNRWGRP